MTELSSIPSRKRKAPELQDRPPKQFRSSLRSSERTLPDCAWSRSGFLSTPSKRIIQDATAAFIDRTGNDALKTAPCGSCAREMDLSLLKGYAIQDIPSPLRLHPTNPHPAHDLRMGMLLHGPAIRPDNTTFICSDCDRKLRQDTMPELSLANNMWIGDIPHELGVLTLPERVLIAKYFPAAYIVKLFPKKKGARYWDKRLMHSGIKGNVSTYRLDHSEIASMIEGNDMPPPARILSAVIGVTFVGPKQLPDKTLPDMFLVRRLRVFQALRWLKRHNPIYRDITISQDRLNELPLNGIPEEILAGVKYSSDVELLDQERDGYIPEHEEEPDSDAPYEPAMSDQQRSETNTIFNYSQHYSVGVAPADVIPVSDSFMDNFTVEEGEVTEPAVIPLMVNGVIDSEGDDVPANDVLAHALNNTAAHFQYSSRTVWEVSKLDELIMYRMKRMRVFGVIQKRNICRAATVQIKTNAFQRNQHILKSLKPADLLTASREETRRVPFSNPAVQALRKNITAVRGRIPGTDESRTAIRSKIWSTIVMHNPPNLWITINPPDTQDSIAQVMSGEDIDLDRFNALLGPSATQRSINVASDPFASARYFHTIIRIVLEEMFGITVRRGHNIERREGIFGVVNSYIGTVEAQGRGSLHLHLLLWLKDSPTSNEMQSALSSEAFSEKMRNFIKANIRADIDGMDTSAVKAMPVVPEISYSRPIDPRKPNFEARVTEREHQLARAVQVHATDDWVSEDGEWGPKRKAGCINNFCPPLMNILWSNHDIKLIISSGEAKHLAWYLSRYAAKKQLAAFNASALLAKSLAYFYAEEKRKKEILEMNKRLIQRCANTLSRHHEFSGPEVMSYIMGWGDRYESHHYVTIYWDSALNALKRQFPELKGRRNIGSIDEGLEMSRTEAGTGDKEDTSVRLVFEDGEIKVYDQLKDYRFRGHALTNSSFLDFFLNTYEGTLSDLDFLDRTHVTSRSERVPYKSGSEKKKRCRIIRRAGHETLPLFVGRWFPRSDDPDSRELYCASMLMLLKPWESLSTLKAPFENFATAFDHFFSSASHRDKRIMENIQFYHDSSDSAKQKADEAAQISGFEPNEADDEELETEPFPDADDEDNTYEITEDDIERARRESEPPKEIFFGENAMLTAVNVGIFSEERPSTAYRPFAQRIREQDVHQINKWTKALKSFTCIDNLATISDRDFNEFDTPSVSSATHLGNEITPSVISVPSISIDYESLINRQRLEILNADQMRAYLIIERQTISRLRGENVPQLLMLVLGQGGTEKSLLIEAITETFKELGIAHRLAKTASSGVAASLIGGDTLHSWAGIPVNMHAEGADWTERGSRTSQEKRTRNIAGKLLWLHDELSMTTKDQLCLVSEATGKVLVGEAGSDATVPFGGLDVVLFGDFHQFPPVRNRYGALYCNRPATDKIRALIGREIYLQFNKVVILKEQKRIRDPVWNRILSRLRNGECVGEDISELKRMILSHESCDVPDFDSGEWSNAILVTSRHGVRNQWNTAALKKHCAGSGNRLYVSQAEDTIGTNGAPLTNTQRLIVASMTSKHSGKLPERVQLAVGMKAMVLINIATEAEIANGTRGVIIDIALDHRESTYNVTDDGQILLRYPPAVILFKPDIPLSIDFEGFPKGIIPIAPTEVTFRITTPDRVSHQIRRRQLAVTPAYAFTDYKSQGQTIERVIVDLAKPPTGELTPFHAYVALSRGRGRDSIRLLRDFADNLFTTHPSEDLRQEDARLEDLDRNTF
ncbi:ATP-dependent DNA helicase RRM3 [Hypsizygus marmoreus]|uniref:ATP-dependent DNA helicase n=1 Tax=Hypsizygus marmoreus TaxID=39966 RepID=A0A369K607_HYPMA|nr:ATP-dependent DNA helicase RRM3 [Hypsizygus marmoreus]